MINRSDARNPGLSKPEIESELRRVLGVDKIIWFPGFQHLDVTDVHADAKIQFVRLPASSKRPPRVARGLVAGLGVVSRERDARGRQFEIHTIDEPDPKLVGTRGQEDPATNYVNFYFVNGGVVLPQFGDVEMDKKALETKRNLLPDRIVKEVYSMLTHCCLLAE